MDKKGFPKSNSNKSNLTAHEFFNQTNNKYQTPLLPKPQYFLSIKNLSPTEYKHKNRGLCYNCDESFFSRCKSSCYNKITMGKNQILTTLRKLKTKKCIQLLILVTLYDPHQPMILLRSVYKLWWDTPIPRLFA